MPDRWPSVAVPWLQSTQQHPRAVDAVDADDLREDRQRRTVDYKPTKAVDFVAAAVVRGVHQSTVVAGRCSVGPSGWCGLCVMDLWNGWQFTMTTGALVEEFD
jgi:hypothetical protein